MILKYEHTFNGRPIDFTYAGLLDEFKRIAASNPDYDAFKQELSSYSFPLPPSASVTVETFLVLETEIQAAKDRVLDIIGLAADNKKLWEDLLGETQTLFEFESVREFPKVNKQEHSNADAQKLAVKTMIPHITNLVNEVGRFSKQAVEFFKEAERRLENLDSANFNLKDQYKIKVSDLNLSGMGWSSGDLVFAKNAGEGPRFTYKPFRDLRPLPTTEASV